MAHHYVNQDPDVGRLTLEQVCIIQECWARDFQIDDAAKAAQCSYELARARYAVEEASWVSYLEDEAEAQGKGTTDGPMTEFDK